MAHHHLLYGRPISQDETPPTLAVTGVLAGYTPGDPYEGRLAVVGNVGKFTVEVLETTLPDGHRVLPDNFNNQLVVAWDGWDTTPTTEVPNGDFERGNDGSWLLGPGWSIGTGADYQTQDGTYSARFLGYTGWSIMELVPRISAQYNDSITATARVQQGASSAGNAAANVTLEYLGPSGDVLASYMGTDIDSGSGGAWHTSTAQGVAPPGTVRARLLIVGRRHRENKPLWVDQVSWNHSYVPGQNNDDRYFLRLRVRDSLNREAYWQGYVEEATNAWVSQLYPVHAKESLSVSGVSTYHFAVPEAPDLRPEEPLLVSLPTATYFGIRNVALSITAPQESFGVTTAVATAFALREVTVTTGSSEEVGVAGPEPTRFGIRPEPVFAVSTHGTMSAPVATRFSIG